MGAGGRGKMRGLSQLGIYDNKSATDKDVNIRTLLKLTQTIYFKFIIDLVTKGVEKRVILF